MRLKSIKLAGFKSFVDPTTVSFPDNLSAVVGPNGCGKSNVIDAVRWVMGESSAKHLRGESMTDVIFNGSNARKPTTQASVELVFDNSQGGLGGEYASFNEIGVKRQVTRDGQSNYYLNGTKCRRKDITDIFLGTGLGPRSYAIIEQGMISRLIEAKPEELRVYIEEAAGISKYKERRKETEHRMRRTRENLERLDDVRDELGRQLQHLERQAEAAEKYKRLKAEEREMRAQLQGLQWQQLQHKVEQREVKIRDLEVKLEAVIADQRGADAAIEAHREQVHELTDKRDEVQGRYYSLGADIARIEQTIQHNKERGSQLRQDLERTSRALEEAQTQMSADQQMQQQVSDQLNVLEPEQELADAAAEEAAETLLTIEDQMMTWQHEWDGFTDRANEPRQRAQVEQSRIQHLEQSVERLRDRIQRLQAEQQSLSAGPLADEIAELNARQEEYEINLETEQLKLGDVKTAIQQQRESNQDLNRKLDEVKSDLQSGRGRHASLEALQQAALGDSSLQGWLQQKGLDQFPRLAQQLKAEAGWEQAIETVLGDFLQAVCVPDLDGKFSLPAELEQGVLTLFQDGAAPASAPAQGTTLAQKVSAPVAARGWLESVLVAADFDQALQLRHQLQPGQSVITPQGIWLSKHWIRVAKADSKDAGVLQRQQDLERSAEQIASLEMAVDELTDTLAEAREKLQQLEEDRDQVQSRITELGHGKADVQAQVSAKQVRLEQFNMRSERIAKELGECRDQQTAEQGNLKASRLVLQEAMDLMAQDTERKEQLIEQRDQLKSVLEQHKSNARSAKDRAHQLALQVQQLKAQHNSAQQAWARLEGQLSQYSERQQTLKEQLAASDNPEDALQEQLEQKLEQRQAVEEELGTARRALEELEHQLRNAEQQRQQAEQSAQSLRSELEQTRMDWQGIRVQRENLLEQLKAADFELQPVLDSLPEEATEAQWQENLERLGARISRLGAINLAAIEEFKSQSERKHYLDSQHGDLSDALATLEDAIRKIDRETRSRFKETFDKVTQGLSDLFPRVFGGGSAYLELTGDDLLDTGVAIMARPPGKKNSTIHLLSGGEKALTAIALVFSIFQLNPAPFCMLDEVDAPLDDANVGRYSRMVEEMSSRVQFIYITHNKIAMEMAHQLLGVTMHEPGVSRLVSVDVEEAAAMAIA